jgi:hypothetical protein
MMGARRTERARFCPAPSRASMHDPRRPARLSAREVRWSRRARDAHDLMS